MTLPLILLFEVSVAISKVIYSRKGETNGILRDIGAPGLIIIILGALLIFGPKRLPELGQSIGKMFAEFKTAVNKGSEEADQDTKEAKEEKE